MSFWDIKKEYYNANAIIDFDLGREFTYADLHNCIEEIKSGLAEGERRLNVLLADNSFISISAYLSLLISDQPFILLPSGINKELLSNIVGVYKPASVISKEPVNIPGYKNKELEYKKIKFNLNVADSFRAVPVHPDLAVMLSTSGSTGSGKLVKLTKKNLSSNAASIADYLNIKKEDNVITSMPMSYSYGLSIINTHLAQGAVITCTNKSFVQRDFWSAFNSSRCNNFGGVPYIYQTLAKMKFEKMKLENLRYFTQAGGHLNSSVKKYFLEYAKNNNADFIVMYGQTEATARISYVPFDKLESKIESIGIAIPDGVIEVVNDKGEKAAPFEEGELRYSGPNVMMGYAEGPSDLRTGGQNGGTLETGDIGYYDDEGFFFVTGRKKRFIKLYGNRINLDDVEKILERKLGVICAAAGSDDRLMIFIEGPEEADLKNLTIAELREKIKIHPSNLWVNFCEKLPLKDNNKKDYNKLIEDMK